MEFQENGKLSKTYGRTMIGYNLIDNQDRDAESSKRFESTNASDRNDLVGTFPRSGVEDVESAARAAKKAFRRWKETPAPVRAKIIGRVGELLRENKEKLSYLITREIGKTLKESGGSVQEAIDTCEFFQSEGRRLYGMTVPSEMRHKELFTYRRPYGVVAVITPSNFPIAVPSWKIIPALLTGNTVVWKSPPESPAISYAFARLLIAAGLPPGVLNLVHGNGKTGEALVGLVEKGMVQKVSFTGSTAVGRKVGEICGRNIQIPSLELGGKNPLVVMEDANIDLAVEGAIWASFGTAGQRCTSAGNIIVQRSVSRLFKEHFYSQARNIRIGNPLLDKDALYGPMISEAHFDRFMNHFGEAEKGGARLVMGKGRVTKKDKPAHFVGDPEVGFFVWPTIWEDVSIDQWIAQEEVFGPAISIIEVSDIDEAIAAANGTKYGLSAAIYTQDRLNAYRFKTEVEAGMISINNSTTGAEAHLPFGGFKSSGNGTRESGVWVIDAYTQWQAANDELSGRLQLAQMDTEEISPEHQVFDLTPITAAAHPQRG